jgi:hypothetical protein
MTRSVTFIDDGTRAAEIYRHCDGYPEAAGQDIYIFCSHYVRVTLGHPEAANLQFVAESYALFLEDLRGEGDPALRFITGDDYEAHRRAPVAAWAGLEYCYFVDLTREDKNGYPIIECRTPEETIHADGTTSIAYTPVEMPEPDTSLITPRVALIGTRTRAALRDLQPTRF